MQQLSILRLACLALLESNQAIFNHTFHAHGVTSEQDILNLADYPLDGPDIGYSIQSLCSNLVTDMDDPPGQAFYEFPLGQLTYPILDSVHPKAPTPPLIHGTKYHVEFTPAIIEKHEQLEELNCCIGPIYYNGQVRDLGFNEEQIANAATILNQNYQELQTQLETILGEHFFEPYEEQVGSAQSLLIKEYVLCSRAIHYMITWTPAN